MVYPSGILYVGGFSNTLAFIVIDVQLAVRTSNYSNFTPQDKLSTAQPLFAVQESQIAIVSSQL